MDNRLTKSKNLVLEEVGRIQQVMNWDILLMSMESYEAHYNKERIYQELEISEQQIREGRGWMQKKH